MPNLYGIYIINDLIIVVLLVNGIFVSGIAQSSHSNDVNKDFTAIGDKLPSKIVFKSFHKKYLSARRGGGVEPKSEIITGSEIFDVEIINNGSNIIALKVNPYKNKDTKYVSWNSGTGKLSWSKKRAMWEQWTVHFLRGNKITLRSVRHGDYIGAKPSGTTYGAKKKKRGKWEIWAFKSAPSAWNVDQISDLFCDKKASMFPTGCKPHLGKKKGGASVPSCYEICLSCKDCNVFMTKVNSEGSVDQCLYRKNVYRKRCTQSKTWTVWRLALNKRNYNKWDTGRPCESAWEDEDNERCQKTCLKDERTSCVCTKKACTKENPFCNVCRCSCKKKEDLNEGIGGETPLKSGTWILNNLFQMHIISLFMLNV